jgi:calcineurin-like phosphoesterase family protein
LLDQLNKRVKPQDTLYHLGDVGFGFAWRERFKELRSKIRCERIILILGNHDHVMENKKNEDVRSLFTRIEKLYFGKIAGRAMTLCHYAMKTWPWQHQQSIHLYGHSHGNLPDDPNALSLDVGVDTHLYGHEKFVPYSAEEIFHIMSQKRFVPLDHHA